MEGAFIIRGWEVHSQSERNPVQPTKTLRFDVIFVLILHFWLGHGGVEEGLILAHITLGR